MENKQPRGRPPKPEPERIPDTFENIIKALVKPFKPRKD
jgi:hypothetical protein